MIGILLYIILYWRICRVFV